MGSRGLVLLVDGSVFGGSRFLGENMALFCSKRCLILCNVLLRQLYWSYLEVVNMFENIQYIYACFCFDTVGYLRPGGSAMRWLQPARRLRWKWE